ncbi:MAG: ExbD/TolR family protein [Bacteroidota bacterium]
MAKFRKGGKKEIPTISTASLPDIVFMLLFFFMVSTVIRETALKVDNTMPSATEVKKLEKKSLVSYIYIGKPKRQYQGTYGTEPRIQLNDAFADVDDIRDYIHTERQQMKESDRPKLTTSLKVDEDTKMGIVTDVKQALRRASALKISYAAREVEEVY